MDAKSCMIGQYSKSSVLTTSLLSVFNTFNSRDTLERWTFFRYTVRYRLPKTRLIGSYHIISQYNATKLNFTVKYYLCWPLTTKTEERQILGWKNLGSKGIELVQFVGRSGTSDRENVLKIRVFVLSKTTLRSKQKIKKKIENRLLMITPNPAKTLGFVLKFWRLTASCSD